MNYIDALRQATSRLPAITAGDETEVQAAIRLACLAFEPPSENREWHLLGFDLLTVLAELYPDPAPITLAVTTPAAADARTRAGVARLSLALADVLRAGSGRADLPVRRRLDLAAAGNRLYDAARALT